MGWIVWTNEIWICPLKFGKNEVTEHKQTNPKNKSDKQKIKDPVNSTFNSFLDFLVQLLFELTRIAQNLSITENLVFGIPILLGPR